VSNYPQQGYCVSAAVEKADLPGGAVVDYRSVEEGDHHVGCLEVGNASAEDFPAGQVVQCLQLELHGHITSTSTLIRATRSRMCPFKSRIQERSASANKGPTKYIFYFLFGRGSYGLVYSPG